MELDFVWGWKPVRTCSNHNIYLYIYMEKLIEAIYDLESYISKTGMHIQVEITEDEVFQNVESGWTDGKFEPKGRRLQFLDLEMILLGLIIVEL
jgi:hypothetical protein